VIAFPGIAKVHRCESSWGINPQTCVIWNWNA